MNDQEWEQHIQKATEEDKSLKQVVVKQSSAKLNFFLALLSPTCFFLAFFLPSNWAEWLVFSVSGLGGLCSLGILATYAYNNNVTHKTKEAALSFLLGNLFVFFAFLLKPT